MNHIVGDVVPLLGDGWDGMVAHPPCTFFAYSGARWWKSAAHVTGHRAAVKFVEALWSAPIRAIAIENPRGRLEAVLGKAHCVTSPHEHGSGLRKTTWLWLKGLPPLLRTRLNQSAQKGQIVSMGSARRVDRSRTAPELAEAIAQQWASFMQRETNKDGAA